MALDKQKILNELGNVVNQLQSADCGCMGKLFNQGNANSTATPWSNGCVRNHRGCGCISHSCNVSGAGEPYPNNNHFMGHCNPPKLYADTYSYLNQNIMQPVVKEVYDDLKSMTPDNTLVNSPMAAQMGLTHERNQNFVRTGNLACNMNQSEGGLGNTNAIKIQGGATGNPKAMSNNNYPGPHLQFGYSNNSMSNANIANTMGMNNQQQILPVSEMGQQIVNMMKGAADARSAANIPTRSAQQGGSMSNNSPQVPEIGMSSNLTGNTDLYNTSNMQERNSQEQYNTMRPRNVFARNPNLTTQYMSHNNTFAGGSVNPQVNRMACSLGQMKPGSQPQMITPNRYGQHSAGITKFNEMFPGVMQGGDLGFDPMAIALQMNPANQQKTALNTIQNLMMGKDKGTENTAGARMSSFNQLTNPSQQNPSQPHQQIINENSGVPIQNYSSGMGDLNKIQQHTLHQETLSQPNQQQCQDQSQHQITVTGSLPAVCERSEDKANQEVISHPLLEQQSMHLQKMYLDPILPADTTRNLSAINMSVNPGKHQNNTLAPFRSAEFNVPQIISPKPVEPSRARNDPLRYSNVKSTISRTSLIGNQPVGKNASRTQLQHLYNQYKGSHSFTQPAQLYRSTDNSGSYSEGRVNVQQQQQSNAPRQRPVEKVGGDSAANNNIHYITYQEQIPPDQVGDIPETDKPSVEDERFLVKRSKVRNGLQDQTYTAYTKSAAWSFHGS